MKKIIFYALLGVSGGVVFSSFFQSCTTIASSKIGVTIIKQFLFRAIDNANRTYSDKQSFLNNDLIVRALPDNLQSVYNLIQKVSPSMALKVKENIAEVASETIVLSTPILRSAVNELNGDDVARILNGGEGIATQILKEKSERKLIEVFEPKVNEKLNSLGVTNMMNTVLKGQNVLNSLLGGRQKSISVGQNDLSRYVTRQLVDGIFYLISNYENQQKDNLLNSIK